MFGVVPSKNTSNVRLPNPFWLRQTTRQTYIIRVRGLGVKIQGLRVKGSKGEGFEGFEG